jgi:glycosyltransferase involved in cell wall biosynthesis
VFAPIAVFGFNRAKHLETCLKSLEANPEAKESALIVFVDGPRNSQEVALVEATRDVARREYSFASVEVIVRATNMGLAPSIIAGVNYVLENSDRIVVIEDDLWVAPTFLNYMNQGLDRYRDFPKVASIHGYCFQFDRPLAEPFFLRGADCLGWATWKDRWTSISLDSGGLLKNLKEQGLENAFNLDGAHSYTSALEGEIKQGLHSWAIHWHASMFVQNRLTLYPGVSLIQYLGADGSGTHFVLDKTHWDTELSQRNSWEFPEILEESEEARNQLVGYFRRIWPSRPFFIRVFRRLRRIIRTRVNKT